MRSRTLQNIRAFVRSQRLKTLCINAKHVEKRSATRDTFGVIIHKKCELDLHKTSRIIIEKGRLEFGKSWTTPPAFASLLKMGKDSRFIIKGDAKIFNNCSVFINESATLEVGNIFVNSKANISCFEKIVIGDNSLISEDVIIRDSDNHTICYPGYVQTKGVEIGNKVFIGMRATILKGVRIGDGAIIAAGAVVNDNVPDNCLAGGVPAKILKHDVRWEL
jgi:acetyltransferase-like isoleucine patch superfamily enzyme